MSIISGFLFDQLAHHQLFKDPLFWESYIFKQLKLTTANLKPWQQGMYFVEIIRNIVELGDLLKKCCLEEKQRLSLVGDIRSSFLVKSEPIAKYRENPERFVNEWARSQRTQPKRRIFDDGNDQQGFDDGLGDLVDSTDFKVFKKKQKKQKKKPVKSEEMGQIDQIGKNEK